MSTLSNLSVFLGKAMNLPPIFFKKIPIAAALDAPVGKATSKTPLNKGRAQKKANSNGGASSSQAQINNPVTVVGTISIGNGSDFAIEGIDFQISPSTFLVGNLQVGASARIKGIGREGGVIEASSVVVV